MIATNHRHFDCNNSCRKIFVSDRHSIAIADFGFLIADRSPSVTTDRAIRAVAITIAMATSIARSGALSGELVVRMQGNLRALEGALHTYLLGKTDKQNLAEGEHKNVPDPMFELCSLDFSLLIDEVWIDNALPRVWTLHDVHVLSLRDFSMVALLV